MYLPQRGALNDFKNHTEEFGSIHCFSCDFLALHQYHIICRLQYFASHTLKHHLQPINELATREAVLNHVLFLLTPCTFYTVFVTKILALTDNMISHQLALNLNPGLQHVLYLDRCIFGTFLSSLKHI